MKYFCLIFLLHTVLFSCGQSPSNDHQEPGEKALRLGAEQFEKYLPLLEGKRVGMVVNNTATIGDTHLVDTLLKTGVNIQCVFAPEHGFRGEAADGAKIEDGRDTATGLEIRSLYGATRKPGPEMLSDLDVIIFDIQDVGARFYTFISTMHYTMEAAAENGLSYIVLDRPNPNGNYVDGPVREEGLETFVGKHPIPIVHGLTVGELARMINGQGWLEGGLKCDLTVIPLEGYAHSDIYELPVKPSPNLPSDLSVWLYPSLCLFEGTVISEGRGTYHPFEQVGHPSFKGIYDHSFTPVSIPGMSTYPKFEGDTCYGILFDRETVRREFTLRYLIEFYQRYEAKDEFFKRGIDRLAGTERLKEQISAGMSEEDIRKTWEPALSDYKKMRKQYLLYPEQR